MPAFSTRNSTEPPLAPLTAPVTSMVTVPTFGFGIMPRGPEHLAEPADQRHQVGRGDAAVEIDLAALHLLDQVLGTDHVGAGGLGLVGLGAAREHARPARCGRSRSAGDHAAHHLIGVARIDAEIHRHLDGLVELGLGALLDHLHRFVDRVELRRDRRLRGPSQFSFRALPWRLLRDLDAHGAGGAFDHLMAASMVSQLRSFIFCSAISLHLCVA